MDEGGASLGAEDGFGPAGRRPRFQSARPAGRRPRRHRINTGTSRRYLRTNPTPVPQTAGAAPATTTATAATTMSLRHLDPDCGTGVDTAGSVDDGYGLRNNTAAAAGTSFRKHPAMLNASMPTRTPHIPLPSTHIRRTESEMQLCEDIAVAEQKDLNMFYRLINGIRDRQIALAQSSYNDDGPETVYAHESHSYRLHDQSIASIIQTRNTPLQRRSSGMAAVLEAVAATTDASTISGAFNKNDPPAGSKSTMDIAASRFSHDRPPTVHDTVAPSDSGPKRQFFLPLFNERDGTRAGSSHEDGNGDDDWSVSGFEHLTVPSSMDETASAIDGNVPDFSGAHDSDAYCQRPQDERCQQRNLDRPEEPPLDYGDDEIFELDL